MGHGVAAHAGAQPFFSYPSPCTERARGREESPTVLEKVPLLPRNQGAASKDFPWRR
jgi:hypothetical protein